MTVTELSFRNYTAKSRSGVVHVMVSYIIKNFYMIYWIPCLYEMKIKVWNAAEIGFFILTSCALFRGGWWLQLSFMLSPFFQFIWSKKATFHTRTHLKWSKTGLFFPLFFRFSCVGGQKRHFRLLFGIWPKGFFFFPLSTAGRSEVSPPSSSHP